MERCGTRVLKRGERNRCWGGKVGEGFEVSDFLGLVLVY